MSEEKEVYLVGNEKEVDGGADGLVKNHKELSRLIESLVKHKPGKKPDFFSGSEQEYHVEFYQIAKRHIEQHLEQSEDAFHQSLIVEYTELLFSSMADDPLEKETIATLLENFSMTLKHLYR